MLDFDRKTFETDYSSACRYLIGAQLRYEHYSIVVQMQDYPLNDYQKKRLEELSQCPAITECYPYQRYLERQGIAI